MKLIVWDFDGTLADSRPLIVAGMEHALAGLGLQDLPGIREAWLAQVGLPVEEGLARIFEGRIGGPGPGAEGLPELRLGRPRAPSPALPGHVGAGAWTCTAAG